MSSKNNTTQQKILKACWKLLEENQGKNVRMSDIAKQTGISRQALYLHYKTRSDLLIATTHYLDEVKDVDQRLYASRTATSGYERLETFIEAWGNYIPEIYSISKALLAIKDSDQAAADAWQDRMMAIRHGCTAIVTALKKDKKLSVEHTEEDATDILWTLLTIRNWEHLTIECGWSQEKYIKKVTTIAWDALTKSKRI